jgi:PTS system ascorbate-specific IIA component
VVSAEGSAHTRADGSDQARRDREPALAAAVNVTVGDWRGAIRAACAPLVDAGAVERRYIDHCIALVEREGPYIVAAPGMALAHARPEDGVRRLCLSSITLSASVKFGHEENDPVDLVFAFGSPDNDQHVGLLSALARHLLAGLADELRNASETHEVENLLGGIAGDIDR